MTFLIRSICKFDLSLFYATLSRHSRHSSHARGFLKKILFIKQYACIIKN